MRKKGFTLVELLVVIAIIALLMGILMPALARVRMIANRMVCGSSLSGIGKALLLYAGDAQEAYPMPGNGTGQLTAYATVGKIGAATNSWDGYSALTSAFNGALGGNATIGSLLYMLVKYEDVSPKQFNCKGDSGAEVFKLTTYTVTTQTDLTKCYDFGSVPGKHNSYAYHFPFSTSASASSRQAGYPIGVNNKPSSPLAADRNPGLDKNASTYILGGTTPGGLLVGSTANTPFNDWSNNNNDYKDKDLVYNSAAHQREGQNVLYNDGHAKFELTTNVGVNNDNIYQQLPVAPPNVATKAQTEAGGFFPTGGGNCTTNPTVQLTYTELVPAATDDALLINEVRCQ